MMDNVSISDVKGFRNIIEATEKFLDEVRIKLDNDGMRFDGLTRGNTVFVSVEFSKHYFEVLGVDEPYTLDISTSDLLNVLKMGRSGDELTLKPSSNDLGMVYDNLEKRTHKEFIIKLIELDAKTLEMPNIEHEAYLEVEYGVFKDMVKDAELMDNIKTRLSVDNDYLLVDGVGDFGEVHDQYTHGEVLNLESPVTVSLTTQFLIDMLRLNISDFIECYLVTDKPALFQFKNPSGDAVVRFLIAPRIEEE